MFYKIFCHIIFRKIFGLSQHDKFRFFLFSFFVTGQVERRNVKLGSIGDMDVGGWSECR